MRKIKRKHTMKEIVYISLQREKKWNQKLVFINQKSFRKQVKKNRFCCTQPKTTLLWTQNYIFSLYGEFSQFYVNVNAHGYIISISISIAMQRSMETYKITCWFCLDFADRDSFNFVRCDYWPKCLWWLVIAIN